MATDHDQDSKLDTGQAGPWHVPRETTPVWESELLLSLGLVIAVLQLPDAINHAWLHFFPRLSEDFFPVLVYGYLFATCAVYALLLTFVVHLVLRGFWVAALGTRAVFPNGVNWENVRGGPITRAELRRRIPPMDQVVERCDNAASLIFALGFVLLGMTFSSGLGVFLASIAAALATPYIPGDPQAITVVVSLLAVVMGPYLLAHMLDRFVGDRISPAGPIGRFLTRIIRGGNAAMALPVITPLMTTLTSRLGGRRGVLILILLVYALMAVAVVQIALMRNAINLDGYRYVGRDDGLRLVEPRHYANQRVDESTRYSTRPFVQSDIIRGPFVRLFIPYSPRRTERAIAESCPDVAALPAETFEAESRRRSAVLECARGLFDVRLNGAPQTGLQFDFGADAASEMRGFVAYLPTKDLARGRHELSVRNPPRSDDPPLDPADDGRFHIPFWF
jgi:hypothetical protein